MVTRARDASLFRAAIESREWFELKRSIDYNKLTARALYDDEGSFGLFRFLDVRVLFACLKVPPRYLPNEVRSEPTLAETEY
jgi:hypothetical protein